MWGHWLLVSLLVCYWRYCICLSNTCGIFYFSKHRMNKKWILIVMIGILIGMTGCTSKSYQWVDFDTFTMKWYNHQKQYITSGNIADQANINIITAFQETPSDVSGYTNSLLIAKMSTVSWTKLQDIVSANTNTFQIKLLQYTPLLQQSKDIQCGQQQYSWYVTTFSYDIAGDIFYQGQYFMIQDTTLYIISLSSDDAKDMKYFTKSINTIQCKNNF